MTPEERAVAVAAQKAADGRAIDLAIYCLAVLGMTPAEAAAEAWPYDFDQLAELRTLWVADRWRAVCELYDRDKILSMVVDPFAVGVALPGNQ